MFLCAFIIKILIRFTYRWLFISLTIHIIVAWFSIGFYHYDEHFQILEFAGFKAGNISSALLPWEYAAHIRPAFQPFIGFGIIKILGWFHVQDPFLTAWVLRIFSALLGWFSTALLTLAGLQYFSDDRLRKLFVIFSAVFSALFFIHARFSSEGWAGSLAFAGIAIILLLIKNGNTNKMAALLSAGFLLGLAFVCRAQTVFLFPGLFLWLFFIGHFNVKKLLIICTGGALAIFIGFVLDHWFYGVWVNTAYKYFTVNIIEGKAAQYGTEPWWWYLKAFLSGGFWPVQLLILILSIIGCIKYFKNPLIWICLPFLFIHFFIAHKEMRFLFLLIEALPLFLVLGLNAIIALRASVFFLKVKWPGHILVFCIIIYNGFLILEMCLRPPSPYLYAMHYIYLNHDEPTGVIINDYALNGMLNGPLYLNFYKKPQEIFKYIRTDSIKNYAAANNKTLLLMIDGKGFGIEPQWLKLKPELVPEYYQFPIWLKKFDFNHWTERTSFWRVYKINLKK